MPGIDVRPVRVLATALLLASLVAGCATDGYQAPVSDRSPTPVVRGGVAPGNAQADAGGPGLYTVRPGDTIYSIAKKFGLDYHQIADWNGLDSTYLVHPDQVLKVAPPDPQSANAVAEARPVGGGSVEQRPLGSGPGAVASTDAGSTGPVTTSEAIAKSSPTATKRPYSDANLAELSRPDPGFEAPPGTAANPAPATFGTSSAAPQGPPNAPVTDEASIGWIWPAKGPLLSEFNDPKNKGIDIAGKLGDPIVASGSGTVIYVGQGLRGLGNLVVVKHTEGLISVYAHNSKILVANNQPVKRGDQIAEMGKSDSEKVELHFEIRRQGAPVDPMKFLPSR